LAAGAKEIIVIGAGGHGSEVAAYIRLMAAGGMPVELGGFIDDNVSSEFKHGARVLGRFNAIGEWLSRDTGAKGYITGVGDNGVRELFVRRLSELNLPRLEAWTLIHPSAFVGRDNKIGGGTCLAPASIVTTNVRIGEHCILNVKASVSHDCVIGDFCNINPGAVVAGNVTIGRGAYIGAGATVIEKVTIGEWAVIGAGAVVVNDIPPFSTAVGVPAKVIKRRGI